MYLMAQRLTFRIIRFDVFIQNALFLHVMFILSKKKKKHLDLIFHLWAYEPEHLIWTNCEMRSMSNEQRIIW